MDLVRLPVPAELVVVLVRPEQQMRTAEARAVLPATLPLRDGAAPGGPGRRAGRRRSRSATTQLLGRAIDDRIAEPARAGLLPGFAEAKAAALAAGALGSSISGSGPTAFALTRGRAVGRPGGGGHDRGVRRGRAAERRAGGAGGPWWAHG